jgi:hypothetical protein
VWDNRINDTVCHCVIWGHVEISVGIRAYFLNGLAGEGRQIGVEDLLRVQDEFGGYLQIRRLYKEEY